MKRNGDVELKTGIFSSGGWKSVGASSVAVFLILMVILNTDGSSAAFESPILLALLNTIFSCAIPLFIAYFAMKSHHATGVFAFLMVGCGLVFFGVSNAYAGWVMPLAGGSNPPVTVHNLGSLFAGACQFAGAHFFLQELAGVSENKVRVKQYWILYAGIFVLVSIIAILAFRGYLPVFFDPLTGPSPLRQFVLGGAICLFAVAGLTFIEIYAATKTEFAYWYGLALWLIAIGLTCVLLTRSVGSVLGWTGRGAQYLGSIYLIFAFLWGRGEIPAATSSSTAKTDWVLWPYLEQRVRERTNALVRINEAMKNEITKRKRVEETLRGSEERFRTWIENSSDLVTVVGLDGTIHYESPSIEPLLGYKPEELIGTNAFDLMHPDDRERVMKIFAQNIQTPESAASVEFRLRHTDGSWRIFDGVGKSYLDEHGQMTGLINSRDITKRKRAEEAVRHSHNLLDLTGQIAKVGGWDLNLETQTLIWTEAVYRIHEVDPATRPNVADAINFYAPESQSVISAAVQAAIDSGTPWDLELQMITAKGRRIWVRAQGVAERHDGKTVRLYGAFQDITERKRAEEKLRLDSEIMANMADAVYLVRASDGKIVYTNPQFEKMFGYDPGKLIGKHVSIVNAPTEKSPEEIAKEIMEALNKNGVWHGEILNIQKDGTPFWCDASVSTFTHADHGIVLVSVHQDITERKRAEERIQTQVQRLAALRAIDTAIIGSIDLRLTLNVVVQQAEVQLGVDAVAVLLLNPHTQTLTYVAGCGFRGKAIERSSLRLGEGHAGRAALERQVVSIHNVHETATDFIRVDVLAEEDFVCYHAAPLIARGQVQGILELFMRSHRDADEDWIEFFEMLTQQAAMAMDSAALFERLQRSNTNLVMAYDATLEGWAYALDLRDKETEGHSQRVTEMTVNIAREMKISEEEQVHMRRGALLHDIGKMGVPDGILLKPDKLTDEEWGIMRQHPQFAFDMISPIQYLRPALDIPYCHHEKWDGTGYPRGLKGEEIPLAARIFSIVDVWDALISDRPYRKAWTKEKALEHIKAEVGSHFDPKVVEVFLQLMVV